MCTLVYYILHGGQILPSVDLYLTIVSAGHQSQTGTNITACKVEHGHEN